jgi:hypothetical protein
VCFQFSTAIGFQFQLSVHLVSDEGLVQVQSLRWDQPEWIEHLVYIFYRRAGRTSSAVGARY